MESDLKGLGNLKASFAGDSKAAQKCTDGKVCATLIEGTSALNFFIAWEGVHESLNRKYLA